MSREIAAGLHSTRYRLVLAECVFSLMPADGACSVLDIGAGDGRVAAALQRLRPQTTALALETVIRPKRAAAIPFIKFDGVSLPIADASVDVALLLNVLHHAKRQDVLLSEVFRVTRRRVVIKDHVASTRIQRWQLAFLDLLGNWSSGASIRGNYWSRTRWIEELTALGAQPKWVEALQFRSSPWSWLFTNELEAVLVVDKEVA